MSERPARTTKKRRRLVEEETPPRTTRRGGRPSFLQQYDKEIVHLHNLRYKPAKIAELLCSQYSLDPKVVTRYGVESHLHIIKKNSLYPLSPTNAAIDLHANSALPTTCIPFCLLRYFLTFFVGQGTSRAAALAEGLTLNQESDSGKEEEEEEEESSAKDEEILQFLKLIGLIYTHKGEKKWSVFISRSMTATAEVNDPQEDGILVTWEAMGPIDEELLSAREFTGAGVREFDLKLTFSQIFIPSKHPLSLDTSLMMKTFIPPHMPRWMLITVPFKDNTPHVFEKLDPLPVDKMVQEF